jgi:hypothetical protein
MQIVLEMSPLLSSSYCNFCQGLDCIFLSMNEACCMLLLEVEPEQSQQGRGPQREGL